MLERVSPGVVNISVRGTIKVEENPLFEDPFFKRFFDFPDIPQQRQIQSVGSGVIIDAIKGYVVTNHHVIANADEISVILNDQRRLDAEILDSDPQADVAVLRVDPDNLTGVPYGDSDALKVGDFVIAIGNPFSIGQTTTLGIVSALGRSGLGIEGYEDFIQTDASINPGNSGGTLVDQQGRLVGINTAILSRGGGNVGIGFAIPINMVRHLVDQIITHGEVQRGQQGVLIRDLTPDIAEAMRVEADGGAVVSRVIPNSAAERAGLKPGDVIVSLDTYPVLSSAELRNRVGLMRPGQKVELEVIRDGQQRTVKVVLSAVREARVALEGPDAQLSGVKISEMPTDHPLYGHVEGVLVRAVAPGTKAARSGLRPSDIIESVNRRLVLSLDELEAALQRAGNQPLLLHVPRDDSALFLAIR